MKFAKLALGMISLSMFGGLAVACGGIGAGDYAVYRVAFPEAARSGDCQNNADHTSTLLAGGTMVIYALAGDGDDTYYLDTGSLVLKGAPTDDGFSFSGKTTDVNDIGQNTSITTTATYDATVVDDGDQISGTFKVTEAVVCSGNGCGNGDSNTCTTSATFTGVMVDDTAIGLSDNNATP